MEKRKRVLIDMDDTLCDFMGAYHLATYHNPGIQFPQSQLKFFENLAPINYAIASYNTLKQWFDVKILTRPSTFNPLSYMEKRLWVEKHLGFAECKNLIMCYDKTLVKGDYLVDDVLHSGACVPEWEQIHFRSILYPDWASVLNYLEKNR